MFKLEKLKMYNRIKLVAKLVITLGVFLFLVGFVIMVLKSLRHARALLVISNILLIIAIVTYLTMRVFVSLIYFGNKDKITEKQRRKATTKQVVKYSVPALLLTIILVAVSVVKPGLGDLGNVFDMLGANIVSYINPVKGAAMTSKLMKKTGGFMEGICHVDSLDDAIVTRAANIEWARQDIDTIAAYDEVTKEIIPGESYLNEKALWKQINEVTGLKYFCITPYPEAFSNVAILRNGVDTGRKVITALSQAESTDTATVVMNVEALEAAARFYFEDLQGIAYAHQISNELMQTRFTYNNMPRVQATEYIKIQLKAMYDHRAKLVKEGNAAAANIILGYNVCDFAGPEFIKIMDTHHKYCDYVGLDLYIGCFDDIMKDIWYNEFMLQYVHTMTKKPVIMCEFGYLGLGEDKSPEERQQFIEAKYGPEFKNEEDCKNDTLGLINHPNFPASLRSRVVQKAVEIYNDTNITEETITNEQAQNTMFASNNELLQHFYCIMNANYGMTNYPHTREGQAKFFTDAIPQIAALEYTLGAFVYNLKESQRCYFCGQEECPIECGWGIYRKAEDPANNIYYPAYYAIQEAFGKLDQKDKKLSSRRVK